MNPVGGNPKTKTKIKMYIPPYTTSRYNHYFLM